MSCHTCSLARTLYLLSVLSLLLITGCASMDEQPEETGKAQTQESPDGENPETTAEDDGEEDGEEDIEPTVVAYRNYQDPLEPINRAIFSFNDVSYRYVFIPLGRGYMNAVPEGARQSVSNFFYNVREPVYLMNNLLQAKPKAAGVGLLRFGINSTVGILGLFDPATDWFDLEKVDTSFADTLSQYGVGYGFYLVAPFLGPADVRSSTSALVEGIFYPIRHLVDERERWLLQSFDYFQDFAPNADRYQELYEESEDPYIFMRNFYLQNIQRDADYHEEADLDENE